MKIFSIRFTAAVVLLASMAMIGCDKEEDPAGPSNQKPTSPKVTFQGPSTQSSNPYAQQAQGFSQMFNAFASSFSSLTDMPGGTQNGNVWTYTFSNGSFSQTITVELMANGSYVWKVILNGSYDNGSSTPVNLNNWVAFEGTSSADNKSGSWKFYEEFTTTVEAELSWATDAQGNETGTLKTYTNGVLNEQLDIVNNVDGSGSMKLYNKKSGTTVMYLNMEITWIANGTGTYKVYNESGVIVTEGTF